VHLDLTRCRTTVTEAVRPIPNIHCVSKNVPPLVCYNFDIRELILIRYFWQKCHRQSEQSKDAMPLHITCASALPGKTGKRENHIFSLKCCISALAEFN